MTGTYCLITTVSDTYSVCDLQRVSRVCGTDSVWQLQCLVPAFSGTFSVWYLQFLVPTVPGTYSVWYLLWLVPTVSGTYRV